MIRVLDGDALLSDVEQAAHLHETVGDDQPARVYWKHQGMARAYRVIAAAVREGGFDIPEFTFERVP